MLYIDGLVERRGEDVDAGLARLLRAAVTLRDLDPESLAAGLLDRCLGGRRTDDVALVVIRLLPAPPVSRRPAVPARLAGMRTEVRGWARAAALVEDQLGDLQLALGEAVADAVEHAYSGVPGEVRHRVAVAVGGDVEVEVIDDGRWRRLPARSWIPRPRSADHRPDHPRHRGRAHRRRDDGAFRGPRDPG